MRRDDGHEIAELITANLEQVLDHYAPGWEKRRDKGYPLADGPKDLGSFSVNLAGSKRGCFYRFSQGFGGGPVKLLAYLLNGCNSEPGRVDMGNAFEEARRFFNLSSDAAEDAAQAAARHKEAERRRQLHAKAREEAKAEEDLEDAEKVESAAKLWDRAKQISGSAGELYYRNRGITMNPLPAELRYARSLRHQSGAKSGAIIARRVNASGEFVGVWRTYVTSNGEKAFGRESKMGLGPGETGAVRLAQLPADGNLAIAEGIENALSLMELGVPCVWATLSTSGMMNFDWPISVQALRIYPDCDPPRLKRNRDTGRIQRWQPSPGLRAAYALKARADEAELPCIIDMSAPRYGSDANDALRALRRRRMV